nr:prepilin-type N-terminal cleavage/methylation domain-containing protein [Fundidesulfovibrio terrae]
MIVSESKLPFIGPCAGFTMLEVIMALVLIAVAAALFVPRHSKNTISLQAERDTLEKHLRDAQMKAMQGGGIQITQLGAIGQVYGIKCDGTNYWMFAGTNPDAAGAVAGLVDDPSVTLDSGKLSLAAKNVGLGAFTVYFNGYGVPCSSYTSETAYTPLAQPLVATMTGGGVNMTVTVTPYTGFIQ